MLDAGLKSTLVSTGSADNVVVIRQGSQTEVQSGVFRDQASLIETSPEVARGADGQALVSKEVVVLNSLPKLDDPNKRSNVVVRGLPEMGKTLRPQVRITEGRMFRAGSSEIVVGGSVARQFAGVELGQQLSFAGRQWTVVGVFDAGKTAFDSEIWGDVEQMMQAFRRIAYSSVIAKLADANSFDALKARLDEDPRLKVDIKRERRFYEDQSASLSNFITLLGHGAVGDLFARRDDRRDDHDVRGGGDPHGGDWHLAGARLPARLDPRGVPGRVAAAGAARRPGRTDRGELPDRDHGIDDQLPVVLRTRVLVHADAQDRGCRRWRSRC